MDCNEYQLTTLRTLRPDDKNWVLRCDPLLLEGVFGLVCEAGEAGDVLKKHIFQGHELDRNHLAEELGDVAWYLAVACFALGFDLETVLLGNIEKVKGRYPDGYNDDASINRE